MSYRFMRMIVFFDLPTDTAEDRRNYRKFRKTLMQSGFLMMQESVYCKLLVNASAEALMEEKLRKERPPKGLVQLLTITEKQYSRIRYITGEHRSEVVDTDERTLIL